MLLKLHFSSILLTAQHQVHDASLQQPQQ